MTSLFSAHLDRLKAGASQAGALDATSQWISKNTFIGGRPYSYKNHEYQPKILDDKSKELVIQKCSQVGISELALRRSIAMCNLLRNFTIAYTLPTAHFAATVMKTRVNPIFLESLPLKGVVNGDIDNSEVKQFITGSFLYMKGAASSNAPISIPVDLLVHDELDFSDPT